MRNHEIARPPTAGAAAARAAQRTEPVAPAQDDVQHFGAALELRQHSTPWADGKAGLVAVPQPGLGASALASLLAPALNVDTAQASGANSAPAPAQPDAAELKGEARVGTGAAALLERRGGQQGEGGEGGDQNEHEQRQSKPVAELLPAGPFGLFGVLLSPGQVAAPEPAPAALTPTLASVAAVAERMLVAAAADAPEVRVMVRADVMPGVEIRVAREAGRLLVDFNVSDSASLGVLQSAGDSMASELTRRLRSTVVVSSSACAAAEREDRAWMARWKRGER